MSNENKMSGRRQNRLVAIQFIFMWNVNKSESLEEALTLFFETQELERESFKFAEKLILGILENQEIIDSNIKQYSRNWAFDRIAKVDLAILRLAIYELLFRDDIPPIASINEAIELSKEFSTQDSKRFINGILDKVKAQLNRPLRSAQDDQVS